MRISDWSSDVCSSDLSPSAPDTAAVGVQWRAACKARRPSQAASAAGAASRTSRSVTSARACAAAIPGASPSSSAIGQAAVTIDRKSGGEGESESVSVELGGGGIIQKKKAKKKRKKKEK